MIRSRYELRSPAEGLQPRALKICHAALPFRFGILFFLILSAFIHGPGVAFARSPTHIRAPVKGKHILVLCFYRYSLPAYQKRNPAFPAVKEMADINANDLFFEYLDLLQIWFTLTFKRSEP